MYLCCLWSVLQLFFFQTTGLCVCRDDRYAHLVCLPLLPGHTVSLGSLSFSQKIFFSSIHHVNLFINSFAWFSQISRIVEKQIRHVRYVFPSLLHFFLILHSKFLKKQNKKTLEIKIFCSAIWFYKSFFDLKFLKFQFLHISFFR